MSFATVDNAALKIPTIEVKNQTQNLIAVSAKNVNKCYGDKVVLNSICVNVPQANIYGLLGASGCGKTTLLRCVVNRLKADSGEISLFGQHPSILPRQMVGFMPQEQSLSYFLTIEESLFYFGHIYQLDDTFIKIRVDNLVKIRDLPDQSSLISTLSGGEKRRVSLAIAMLHQPPPCSY